jgi:hypothetical protein
MSIFLYASPPKHQSPQGDDVGAFHGRLPQYQNTGAALKKVKKRSELQQMRFLRSLASFSKTGHVEIILLGINLENQHCGRCQILKKTAKERSTLRMHSTRLLRQQIITNREGDKMFEDLTVLILSLGIGPEGPILVCRQVKE